jgi:hypothetical protein
MKTRIVVTQDGKGGLDYMPQRKILFWWRSHRNLYGPVRCLGLTSAQAWLEYLSGRRFA